MRATEIRRAFLDFFAERGHAVIPSAPVVPEHDPTVLFTTAGMHPLVPYLLGESHPAGKRLVDVQKCIRTVDIDEVGDWSHLTFFEMLGNWSLGDYFKEESIAWSWEFLTDRLGLAPEKLAVSVFAGGDDAPRDEEAAALWESAGVPKDRIFYYGKADNWWGPAGQTGPCGPDTEIFYWMGEGKAQSEPAQDERWLEIWNNVFMQYNKTAEGKFEPLAQQNVDTGMGLERMAVILQRTATVYETDLFTPVLQKVRDLAHASEVRAERIVVDHLKAATFMIADGVRPSNTDRGYILRRLIRRAIRQAKHLDIESPFTAKVADVVVNEFSEPYPELERERPTVNGVLNEEEARFAKTLDRGLKELGLVQQIEKLRGGDLFYYFETFGLPFELIIEELAHKTTDQKLRDGQPAYVQRLKQEYDQAFADHQQKSRAGAEQKFAGGLADHSEQVVKLHTATHLLNAALKDVLGEHVKQRGSNITAERLRFDFAHPEKLTEEQINQVEALVNEKIKEDLPVERKEMPREDAERIGAEQEFGHKYPDIVSVYVIGAGTAEFSKEFCGGPHTERTGGLGEFKITKQESVGAGVRRVKATIS